MSFEPTGMGPQERGPQFQRPTAGGPPPHSQPHPPAQPWHGPGAGPAPYGQPVTGPPFGSGPPGQGGPGNPPGPGGYRPPTPERPPKDRRPAILTVAVIGLVVLVVVLASIHGHRNDERAARASATPTPTPSPTVAPGASTDSIVFTSSEGSGQLTVVSHKWTSAGPSEPANGQFLQIKVKISATSGRISYSPEYFQSFDSSSDVFHTTEVAAPAPLLDSGYLEPGDSVTGGIGFDIPRGPVTLLMSNAEYESVTALRIAG